MKETKKDGGQSEIGKGLSSKLKEFNQQAEQYPTKGGVRVISLSPKNSKIGH